MLIASVSSLHLILRTNKTNEPLHASFPLQLLCASSSGVSIKLLTINCLEHQHNIICCASTNSKPYKRRRPQEQRENDARLKSLQHHNGQYTPWCVGQALNAHSRRVFVHVVTWAKETFLSLVSTGVLAVAGTDPGVDVHSSCGLLVAGQDLDSMLQRSMTQLPVHFSSGDHMTFVFSPRPQPTVRACYSRFQRREENTRLCLFQRELV